MESCCATYCQTCQSCSQSCSNGKCSTSCYSYPCNCICISSVGNNQCTVSCNILYTAELFVTYKVGDDSNITNVNPDGTTVIVNSDNSVTISSNYQQDFEQDLTGATNFVNYYKALKTFKCYYDPNNPYVVALNIAYTSWKWAVFAIFGVIPLMMVLILFTLTGFNIITGDRNYEYNTTAPIVLTISTWFGIIIPLVILLPIWIYGLLTEVDKMTVMIFILLFVSFGNMPTIVWLTSLKNVEDKLFVFRSYTNCIFLYSYLVVAPLSIYVPVYLYASKPIGIGFLVFTYGFVLLLVSPLVVVGCMNWCSNRCFPKYPIPVHKGPKPNAPDQFAGANNSNSNNSDSNPQAVYEIAYIPTGIPTSTSQPVYEITYAQNQTYQNYNIPIATVVQDNMLNVKESEKASTLLAVV